MLLRLKMQDGLEEKRDKNEISFLHILNSTRMLDEFLVKDYV